MLLLLFFCCHLPWFAVTYSISSKDGTINVLPGLSNLKICDFTKISEGKVWCWAKGEFEQVKIDDPYIYTKHIS